jgi:hypothetical protein
MKIRKYRELLNPAVREEAGFLLDTGTKAVEEN